MDRLSVETELHRFRSENGRGSFGERGHETVESLGQTRVTECGPEDVDGGWRCVSVGSRTVETSLEVTKGLGESDSRSEPPDVPGED